VSVETSITVRYRPWAYNQVDKALPSGVWYAQGAVIGDATGGHAEVEIVLNAASVRRSGFLYSLELSLPTTTQAGDKTFRMNSLNLDVLGPGLTNPIQKAFVQFMDNNGSVENPNAAAQVRDMHPSLFLGGQGGTATAAALQGQIDNVDTETFGWYATGYVWNPEAMNAPGGLRRPFNGVI